MKKHGKANDKQRLTDTDDSDTLKVITDMFGVMTLTVLAALSEYNLLTPDSDIKNIPIVCLILLEFLQGPAEDLEGGWGCEIGRNCDEHGIVLEDSVRKQVAVSKEDLEELRKRYDEKRGRCEIAKDG